LIPYFLAKFRKIFDAAMMPVIKSDGRRKRSRPPASIDRNPAAPAGYEKRRGDVAANPFCRRKLPDVATIMDDAI